MIVTPPTAAHVYAQSLAAAHAQRSVHYDSTVALAGRTVRLRCDAARDRGRKEVVLTAGPAVGRMTIVVVRNRAYVRGDAYILRNYLALTDVQSRRYAGRWFVVAPSGSWFPAVSAAVRLDSAFDDIAMPGPYSFGASPPGLRLIVSAYENAGQPIRSSLAVRAGGRHLPVRQVSRNPAVGTITTVFSRWNERVSVAAPRGAVPLRP